MGQLVAYFLRLGALGFGGPAALVAIMEDDLAIGDWFTIGVALLSGFVLFRWQIPPPLLVGIAGAAGLVAFYWFRPTWLLVR